MENEKRDRIHQIEQLKWEARFNQMEQQLAMRSFQPAIGASTNSPAQQVAITENRVAQGETEMLHQRMIELTPQEKETGRLQSRTAPLASTMQQPAPQERAPMLLSSAAFSSAPRPQAPSISQPERHQHQSPAAQLESNMPPKTLQPQRQVATGPAVKGGAVMLPSGAQSHFFLSHCQATGGDQCNAIYLELRQLGFACW